MGPKYVGKTQIINRFMNNQFYTYYEETTSCQEYKIAYNLNSERQVEDPMYFQITV
jgi:GTPase SAR1 family protein